MSGHGQILCLPGLWDNGFLFKSFIEMSSSNGWYPVVLEKWANGPTLSNYIGRARTWVHLSRKPVILVGYSLGGLVAQVVASEMPGMVEAVILINPTPPKEFVSCSLRALARMARFAPQVIFGENFRLRDKDYEELFLNCLSDEGARKKVLEHLLPAPGGVVMETAKGIAVEKIDSPVLVVGGLDDKMVPASTQKAVAKKYGAETRWFEDSGHALLVEPAGKVAIIEIFQWVWQVRRRARAAA